MKYLRFASPKKAGIAVASAVVSMGLLGLGTAHAQMLLKPQTGSTIYESTEHGGGYAGANAFDGTFNATQTNITSTGSSNGFASNGDTGDRSPILAFNLNSSFTINGFGYAQFNSATDTTDLVSSINVFSLTFPQYNAYLTSAALVASGTAGGTNSNKAAPTAGNFIAEGSVTGLGAAGYTLFNFNANSAQITGMYFVVQFIGNNPTQNPGALEFELRQAVPEPSSWAFLALGLGGAVLVVRRRRQTA